VKEKEVKVLGEFKEKYMDSPEMYEYETMSIFINGNPFDSVLKHFKPFDSHEEAATCIAIGTITSVKRKKQKNGKTMAYVELLTPEKMIEGMVFASQYTEYQDLLKKGKNVLVSCKKNGNQFVTEKMMSFEEWKKNKGIK
jgi:DNA polymerase III alpha subunit